MTPLVRAPSVRRLGRLRSPAGAAGILLLLAFAVLYGLTLDNGLRPGELEGGDLITHQYAQVQARFSNAPGYPLYTMGGWLWFRAGRLLLGPDANPIRILAGYSALWALIALGLLYVVALEVTASRAARGAAGRSEVYMPWAAPRRMEIERSILSGAPQCAVEGCGAVFHPRPHPSTTWPEQHGHSAQDACLFSGQASRPAPHLAPGDGARHPAWPVALLAAAFYGVTYFFWYYAVTTEQYTSSVAWTLAAILLAFRWERLRRDRYLLGLALLTGIGLAHQITVLAVIPPILWLVLSREPGVLRRGRLIAGILGLALLPLLSYAYVYARGAQHPEWRGAGEWSGTWQWFWAFVSTAQGRAELTWSLRPFLTAEFPALIWREMTWPGLVIGLLGWSALGRRRAVVLLATLLIYLVFCWIDRLGNWYQVIMPVYALVTLGIAAAAARGGRSRRAGAILLLLCLIAYRGVTSYPHANAANRAEDTGLTPAWAILADDPPDGAAILGTHAEGLALNYVTQIWGRRPDVETLTTAQARALLAGPGFVVTEAALPLVPAEVSAAARYSALGRTLIGVRLEPVQAVPADLAPWAHDFAGVVRLVGGGLRTSPAGEQTVLLAWQAPSLPAEDWSVSVRLTRGNAEVAQVDRRHPVFGAYPMTRWSAGEVVVDAYPFALPPDGAADGVTIILYRPAADGGFVNLDAAQFRLP